MKSQVPVSVIGDFLLNLDLAAGNNAEKGA